MNINRHNYETFFLLYVDRELSAADRKAVELFVQENPDLQVELSLLQDAVLKPEDIVLEKKDWLYLQESTPAWQENLLLYTDNELTEADKSRIEALLATDRQAKQEWELLQRSRLEPDTTIVFENKHVLYRQEEGRVIGMRWWRVAAAAILLGFGIWTGISLFRNNRVAPAGNEGQGIATRNGIVSQPKNNPADPGSGNATVPDTLNALTAVSGQENKATAKDQGSNSENNDPKPVQKNKPVNGDPQNTNIALQEPAGIKKETNSLPKSNFENINRQERNEFTVSNVNIPPANSNINTSGVNNVVVTSKPVLTDPVATPVAYTEGDSNNDRYLYMDEDRVRRTKLGGLLRKAKRLLERNANVKTGDGLKVAGFEIALK